jgi:hypothetical protein
MFSTSKSREAIYCFVTRILFFRQMSICFLMLSFFLLKKSWISSLIAQSNELSRNVSISNVLPVGRHPSTWQSIPESHEHEFCWKHVVSGRLWHEPQVVGKIYFSNIVLQRLTISWITCSSKSLLNSPLVLKSDLFPTKMIGTPLQKWWTSLAHWASALERESGLQEK